eukprot:TRINITY_DN29946_c0_g1_i1.p1 TRINITY_DN29946_c0_g1~~TRINITY_DN29946_c0_g1_i1.p1  ORF type:complete len:486 (-),score=97.26 TRINITY_DN29946_c0_g1_i1:637-2094(-)
MACASTLQIDADRDADDFFFQAGYTDGFPVVLPTRQRVQKMLTGTAHAPSDVLGRCPPSYADVTVEKLAIAAVMAGCTPEMFRIVVAAMKAALRPEFGLHGVHATTMGATPVFVVNGPCRHDAKINFQQAVCGSGHRSHCIGRAIKLLLQNVGRAKLGGTESTTLGTPMKFGLCFGEWEERASMWAPLSSEYGGMARDQDAVTVLACAGGPNQVVDFNSPPSDLLRRIAHAMASAYSPHMPFVNRVLLVISPEHYDTLLKAGMDSKKKLAQALWREASKHMLPYIPATIATVVRLRKPGLPFFVGKVLGSIVGAIAHIMNLFGKPFLKIPKFSGPESIQIAVAGGEAGKFSCFMPGFGVGTPDMATANMSKPVTVPVEPRPPALDAAGATRSRSGSSEILNPTSEVAAPLLTLAKRTGRIVGPVGLMDISKARGSELLDVIEQKLRDQGVETRRYKKPTFSRPCPDQLRRTIATECKSVVLGLAD